jgi:hypothetical protein
MRKDLFIVGARLLGLWLIVSAMNPFLSYVATLFIKTPSPSYFQITNILNGLFHAGVGLYFLLGTNNLYNFLERVLDKESR